MFLARELPVSPPLLDSVIRERLNDRQWLRLSNPLGWHQQFYQEVTREIDENIFSVLYADGGRPNVPIYLLVSMLILKEGKNWTDDVLFEQCELNLLVRCALGLNLGDSIPCSSTMDNFKASLKAYAAKTGDDLLEQSYRKLTGKQCKKYEVKGHKVRMDSKLLDSNIAMNSRLELVLGVLIKFYKSLEETAIQDLTSAQRIMLEEIVKKQPQQHRHSLSKAEQVAFFEDLGSLVYELYDKFKDHLCAGEVPYLTLAQVWTEQYELVSQEPSAESTPTDSKVSEAPIVQSKKKDDLNGDVLQSPHDTDARYRRKESGQKTQKVRGYSSNITEVFDEDAPRLITDVQTQSVTTGDSEYFITAIENTQSVTGHSPQEGQTDGAYHSPLNVAFVKALAASGNLFKWFIPKIQGKPGDFDFEWKDDQLIVTQKSTGECCVAQLTKSQKSYRAKFSTGKLRYFTQKDLDNYKRRQEIEEFPKEILKQRANVEATIRQVFCTLNGNKTKYRGRIANHHFVLNRVMWVNFKRIANFNKKKQQNQPNFTKISLYRYWKAIIIPAIAALFDHNPTQQHPQHNTKPKPKQLKQIFTKFYSDISKNSLFLG